MWAMFGVITAEVILVLSALLWLVYKYCTSNYNYWKDRSVPYAEPRFPFGTEKDMVLRKVPFGEHYQNIYNKFKNVKMIGAYRVNKPYLILKDPELIKHVMVKDFHHFSDRGIVDPELLSPVNRTLFIIEGEAWRSMRAKLSPAFTSGKMKMMFHLMEACAEEFRKVLTPIAEKNGKIDVKDLISRFTTDVISSCAFGLESNSIRNPDSEFRRNGKTIFAKPLLLERWRRQAAILVPQIYKLLRLKPISGRSDDFFKKIVNDMVEYREKHGVVRNDFIDLLMKIKHNKCLSDDDNGDIGNEKNNGNSEAGTSFRYIRIVSFIIFSLYRLLSYSLLRETGF